MSGGWTKLRPKKLQGAYGMLRLGRDEGLLTWRSSPTVMWWLHQLGEVDRARIAAAGLQ